LSPRGSPPYTEGVAGRRFIGSSRGAGGRAYWGVTAGTDPDQGGGVWPAPAAPPHWSSGLVRAGGGGGAGTAGRVRAGGRGGVGRGAGCGCAPPAASPMANVVLVPSVISARRTPARASPGARMPKTPRTEAGTRRQSRCKAALAPLQKA